MKSLLRGMSKLLQLYRGGVRRNDYSIAWGGYAQMITILHGGGSLGTPKSDYVICARPLKTKFPRQQKSSNQFMIEYNKRHQGVFKSMKFSMISYIEQIVMGQSVAQVCLMSTIILWLSLPYHYCYCCSILFLERRVMRQTEGLFDVYS